MNDKQLMENLDIDASSAMGELKLSLFGFRAMMIENYTKIVVYSKEKPITPVDDMAISCKQHCICPPGTARKCTQRRQVPGSTAFVPSVVGLIIAGEVVKDLIR